MTEGAPAARAQGGTVLALVLAVFGAIVLAMMGLSRLVADLGPYINAASPAAPGADPASAWGSILGASLAAAAIPWAVMYFAWVIQRAATRGAVYFLIIWAVVFALDASAVVFAKVVIKSNNETKIAVADMRSTLETAARSGASAASIDTRPKGGGDAGAADGLIKRLVAQVLTDHQNYIAEMRGLGFPDILRPDRLAKENLADAAAAVAKAKQVEARYRALNETRLTDLRAQVAHSSLSAIGKQEFVAGMDRAAPADAAKRARLWGLEESILADADHVVTLLASSRGAWRYNGQTLAFSDPAVLADYNAHIRDMQADAQREEQLRDQNMQAAESSLGPTGGP